MAAKLLRGIRLYLRQEPGSARWQRMWVCALVGILAATLFSWAMSTINLVTLPRQHLGLDWHRLWFYWGGLSLIAGMEGLFVGWFTENYEGITFGWMPLELLLVVYLVLAGARKNFSLAASISILGVLEMTGAFIFLAVLLRTVAGKLLLYYSESGSRRGQRIVLLVLAIFFLPLVVGSLARYDVSIVKPLHSFNDTMNGVVADASLEPRLPLEALPELRSHLGNPYKIYPRLDTGVVGIYVLNVVFPDGFSFNCRVSVTEFQQEYYFTDCSPGVGLSFP